jgi:hypothetical protein
MASGTRGSSVPRFSTTGRATSLQHVLKIVLKCDLTSPLYLSVLQHFGGNEDKFNVIDYFLCDQTYFENLSYSETVIENPKEKDPTKVITRVERYHVPNYLRARCIFFKKFLEDKKNDGEDLNYKSFYMGLTLDNFMAWKAEEMTMNTSSLPTCCKVQRSCCRFQDDKICMMTTRLACNRAIESSYWRMDNYPDVGLLMGYVLYSLPVELEFMDLNTFPH